MRNYNFGGGHRTWSVSFYNDGIWYTFELWSSEYAGIDIGDFILSRKSDNPNSTLTTVCQILFNKKIQAFKL